jgi:hypothetical protein
LKAASFVDKVAPSSQPFPVRHKYLDPSSTPIHLNVIYAKVAPVIGEEKDVIKWIFRACRYNSELATEVFESAA